MIKITCCSIILYQVIAVGQYPITKNAYNKSVKVRVLRVNKMHNQFDFEDVFLREDPKPNLAEDDSGFKAWQADSMLMDKNTNLLRNLNSQLQNYEQKYHRVKSKTISVKLPSLQRKCSRKATILRSKPTNVQSQFAKQKEHTQSESDNIAEVMTDRKPIKRSINSQQLYQHKSIEFDKQSSKRLRPYVYNSKISSLTREENSISIAKVHQMKFDEEQKSKRLRKRDIYLSIFGERGKNKVQKLTFDDENKPYMEYMERKRQQIKMHAEKVNNTSKPKTMSSKRNPQKADVMRF